MNHNIPWLRKVTRLLVTFWGTWVRRRKPPPSPRRPRQPSRAHDVEETGQWYFKRDVLQKLDDYFLCMRHMKRHDFDGYHLCGRVGAMISSDKGVVGVGDDCGMAHEWSGWPFIAFGAVAFVGPPPQKDILHAKFTYFRKLTRPPAAVQRSDGTVYEMVIFYTSRRNKELSAPALLFIAIEGKTLRLLRTRRTTRQTIQPKRRGGYPFTVSHSSWGYPEIVDEWDEGIHGAARMFNAAYNAYMQCSAATRVRVEHRGMVAAFGVDLLRMPYFFNDRDWVMNEKGSRQRIFHIVRTHKRTLADGRETFVKSHFRGARSFTWNDYRVNVTMPGKHHNFLPAWDAGAYDTTDQPLPIGKGKGLTADAVAKAIDDHMNV